MSLQEQQGGDDGTAKLTEIIHFLRDALPISALAHDEKMTIPKGDHYEGYTEQNTLHVDEFLYTDEEAQELTDAGLLPQDYCANCGCQEIKHLSTSNSTISDLAHRARSSQDHSVLEIFFPHLPPSISF